MPTRSNQYFFAKIFQSPCGFHVGNNFTLGCDTVALINESNLQIHDVRERRTGDQQIFARMQKIVRIVIR
jgi:hypothetical protein